MQDSLKSVKQVWQKLQALSATDLRLLGHTAMLMAAIRLGLWLLPFQTLRRWLSKRYPLGQRRQSNSAAVIQKVVWAVEVVSWRMPGGVLCLARALTTQALLRRHGCDCELRIGVAKSAAGALEAHAWVEHQGRVIIGGMPGFSRFHPLPSLEGK